MPVILKIAFRNLFQHKGRSLIIGIMIAIGVIVLIIGNSMMDTAREGIERAFINNYTGHVFIHGIDEDPISLFGVQSAGEMKDIPIVPDYQKIKNYLSEKREIQGLTSQVTGYGLLGLGEEEGRVITMLFGIEPESYQKLFENIEITEGRYLAPGEEGIMLSTDRVEEIINTIQTETGEEETEVTIHAGDMIRITGMGNRGIKIREVPLIGTYTFSMESEGVGADILSFVDVQTLRALSGMTIGSHGEIPLEERMTSLLETDSIDLDSLFNDQSFGVESVESAALEDDNLDSILGDTSIREQALQVDSGAWNFILLKLKNASAADRFIPDLNGWFEEQGINARADGWEAAAGPFATSADIIRVVFNVAILIVGIVAIIIMMNTLVISIIERTSEIGTMRALGAQKTFVWKMFFLEILTITLTFGIIGILLSLLIIWILNIIAIPATNTFLRILFAGPALQPDLSIVPVFWSVIVVTVIGVIAHIYPVTLALHIQPIKAIQVE